MLRCRRGADEAETVTGGQSRCACSGSDVNRGESSPGCPAVFETPLREILQPGMQLTRCMLRGEAGKTHFFALIQVSNKHFNEMHLLTTTAK